MISEEAKNALRALARLPVSIACGDDDVIFALGGIELTAGHVRDARNALNFLPPEGRDWADGKLVQS